MNTSNIEKGLNPTVFDPNNNEQIQQAARAAGYTNVEIPDDAASGGNQAMQMPGQMNADIIPAGRNVAIGGNIQREDPSGEYAQQSGSRRQQYLARRDGNQPQQTNDIQGQGGLTADQLWSAMNGGETLPSGENQTGNPGENQVSQQAQPNPQPQDNQQQQVDWQSEARKYQSEKDKLAHEMGLLRNQVSFLMSNGGQQAHQPPQPEVDKESAKPPRLDDFVDDDWDGDVKDKGFLKFQDARDKYVADEATRSALSAVEKSQREQATMAQVSAFADAYPEYKTFDGRPDIQRIQSYFNSLKSMSLVELKKRLDGMTESNNSAGRSGQEVPVSNPGIIDYSVSETAYGQNISASPNVTSGGEAQPTKRQQLPQHVQGAINIFGDMEIPEDFGGLV